MITKDELDQVEESAYRIKSLVRTMIYLNKEIYDEYTIECNCAILDYLLPEIEKITDMF